MIMFKLPQTWKSYQLKLEPSQQIHLIDFIRKKMKHARKHDAYTNLLPYIVHVWNNQNIL